MFFYLLYLIGSTAAFILPTKFSYWVACRVADYSCWRFRADREAVRSNLSAVLQRDHVPVEMVRDVFRNFGMYLVDFFRFGHLTPEKIKEAVRIEGLEHMRGVLAAGRGAIGLTAHLGNFELAGAVLSLMGFPVNAVVLTHQNPYVDNFFTSQRSQVGVKGIPVQRQSPREFFKTCMSVLENNEILALVGDRDFFNHGIELPLFGKSIKIPTGPAGFSIKTGAPIVPGFMIREKDGSYRLILEKPIVAPEGVAREEAMRQMTEKCLEVMAKYIRQYPTQWYGFREFWKHVPGVIL
ncbi:MAG: lysophospholipid acyltransferase family protein [Candidatus Omnitrophica bacterium]|nr:lysophospholipid acyltransferase family protein [Candidatus Omnitrophota bacterium]